MDKLTKINKVERELHAAKGRLKQLRNDRWTAANYKHMPPAPLTELAEVEAQITQYRQQLKELY